MDFNFSTDPLNATLYVRDCVRTELFFNPALPAGVSFSAEIFDPFNVSLGSRPTIGPLGAASSSVGFETFPSGANFDFQFGAGHQLLNFSQALNSITSIRYRGQTPCNGTGTNSEWMPGTLTPLP